MLPTSVCCFSRPYPLTSAPAELAIQPLEFTEKRQCKNKDVEAAIMDALADKRHPDQCIAAIFKNAWQHRYQDALNLLIKHIETQHGEGTVVVNDHVRELLSADQIKLTQNEDGTVQLFREIEALPDPDRQDAIDQTLHKKLPDALCKLISSYDDDMLIARENMQEIIAILRSGDPTAKSLLFAAASHQDAIPALNYFMVEMSGENEIAELDLSHTDLSNLDLSNICLGHTDLSFANLQNSRLENAKLDGAILIHTNLNNTDLSHAVFHGANLTGARLIGANLYEASVRGATLTDTCMLGVNLQGALYGQHRDDTGVVLNCSNIKAINTNFYAQHCVNPDVSPTADVFIVPRLPDSISAPISGSPSVPPDQVPGKKIVIIDESEKNILLAKGLKLKENGDGTAQLRRAVTMYEKPGRRYFWKSSLEDILPRTVTNIIGAYTSEIEISEDNRAEILEILNSDDSAAKGRIIAAACNQDQIFFLNQLFCQIKKQGDKLDLSYVDLSNLDLSWIDLNHADLTGATLQGCTLHHARLHHAILIDANLRGASLRNAELSHADFTDATLTKADLYAARLVHATLKRANLEYADLDSADLRGGSDLSHACLDHANLRDTRLNDAVMINASLNHAQIHRANLNNANLTKASIMHSQLTYTSLMSANLSKTNFSHSLLHRIALKNDPVIKGAIWTGTTTKTIFSDQLTRDALPIQIRPECVTEVL